MESVLHVVPGIPYGGMQRLVAQLVTEQRRQGLDARVLCIYDSPYLSQALTEREIPFSTTGKSRPNIPGFWKYFISLKESNVDIIHLHAGLLWSNALGLLTKRTPWIGHFHSYYHPKTIKDTILYRINLNLLDACIGVSASVSKSLHPWFGDKQINIFTVHNGIEFAKVNDFNFHRKEGRIHYGMATRMAHDKGVWEFIRAAEGILMVQPEARFFLAGDGPLRKDVIKYIRNNHLSEQIYLPGHIKDINTFWKTLDVALFTSPCEPFGLRIIEPMSLGIPVVAYETGCGSDELIQDDITGLKAKWGDVDRLVQQCMRISTDNQLWGSISNEAAKSVTEKFSIERMADTTISIYRLFPS